MDGPTAIKLLKEIVKSHKTFDFLYQDEVEAIKFAISTIESILVSNEEVN